MSHTKENWRVTELDRVIADRMEKANDDYFIADCFGPDAKENARRIVACVNFCAGLDTKSLDSGASEVGGLFAIADSVKKLSSERDAYRDLCAELIQALRHIEGAALDIDVGRSAIALGAKKAIAKAKKILGYCNAT